MADSSNSSTAELHKVLDYPHSDEGLEKKERTWKELIARGADVNAVNAAGETALHIAAKHCNHDAIDVLISAGAKVNAINREGKTPLDVAIDNWCGAHNYNPNIPEREIGGSYHGQQTVSRLRSMHGAKRASQLGARSGTGKGCSAVIIAGLLLVGIVALLVVAINH